jgi:hypothetical protein
MLVNHADTGRHRSARSLEFLGDAIQQNFSTVSGIQTVKHVHESGLSGAVFTEQAVDFAGLDDHTDLIICD